MHFDDVANMLHPSVCISICKTWLLIYEFLNKIRSFGGGKKPPKTSFENFIFHL